MASTSPMRTRESPRTLFVKASQARAGGLSHRFRPAGDRLKEWVQDLNWPVVRVLALASLRRGPFGGVFAADNCC